MKSLPFLISFLPPLNPANSLFLLPVHPPFAQGSANNNQLLKTSVGLVVAVIVVLLIVAALVYWR